MRVRQVNHSDLRGGAARAAWRLNEGLRRINVDSRMVVADRLGDTHRALLIKPAPDLGASTRAIARLHAAQGDRVARGRTALSNTLFSLDAAGVDLTAVDEVATADIVHLHWTSFFLSPLTIARLAGAGRTVVWTLHDQWAYTGGCHYAGGCHSYLGACAGCPQLVASAAPLAAAMLAEKRRTYGAREMTIIAPSRWMAECARRSAVLGRMRIECISNGVDTELFAPGDRRAARAALSLPTDGILVLFGVEYGAEKRKGFEVIADALAALHGQLRGDAAAAVGLLFFGQPAAGIERLGFRAHSLGYVNDDALLRDAYRAADLFVLPSLEDNLPNTMLEAMACGTPVLASASGGMRELIRNADNGLLAATGDAAAFCEVLRCAIEDAETLRRLGRQARRDVEAFSVEAIARQHVTLYECLHRAPWRRPNPQSVAITSGVTANPAGENGVAIAPLLAASDALLADRNFECAMAASPNRWQRFKADLRNARYLLRTGGLTELVRQGMNLLRLLRSEGRTAAPALAPTGIALGAGFKAPEGPYPNYNLPRIAWMDGVHAQLLVMRASSALEVTLGLQATQRLSLRVCADDAAVGLNIGANFGNPQRALHRLTVRIAPGDDWAKVDIELTGAEDAVASVALLAEVTTQPASSMKPDRTQP